MLQYQRTQRYLAQIAGGLEALGAEELRVLGATDVHPVFRALWFSGDTETLYRVNYAARLVSRVLAPLVTFDCHDSRYLYKTVGQLPWSDLFGVEQTFAVDANVANSHIRHSHYAAQVVKDAVVDRFRAAVGSRPNVDRRQPDVWLSLFIHHNRATLSWDTSGGSLHRRGYRVEGGEAPIQETVAAAILKLAEWDGDTPLYDPMCGSGTLLAEALMVATRTPAGYLRRRFGFEGLPDHDRVLWQRVRGRLDGAIVAPAAGLAGSDIDRGAVARARQALGRLPHGRTVRLSVKAFAELDGVEGATIVCNPPYGKRLAPDGGAAALLGEFGDFLKQRCAGSTAYVYLGERALLRHVGLRPSWRRPLASGGLDGRLAKYTLYAGRRDPAD